MKTQKHTPGPWHLNFKPGPIVYSEQGEQVANLFEPLIDAKENRANARLIAASPELLDALLSIVGSGFPVEDEYGYEHWAISEEQRSIARAAIAKAMA
jgi:hypothetical protein